MTGIIHRKRGRPPIDVRERMEQLKRIDPVSGCWIWLGPTTRSGHGMGYFEGKHQEIHRIAFKIYVGEPKNLVLHKCESPACFNPEHLYDGTHSENLSDAYKRGERFPTVGVRGPNGSALARWRMKR